MKCPVVSISNVCQQIRGVSYKGGESIDTPQDGYLPILRANNICEEGILYDDLVFVPQKYVSKTQLLQKNDIVIAASSGSIDIVGKAAPIKEEFKGSFGAFCKVLRPSSNIDPSYLAYFFKTPFYRHTISNLAAGANINNLRNEHLDNLRIPLPSVESQREIVIFLSKAESALEKRRETIRLADEFLKSAFLEMFGDPIRNTKKWPVRKFEDIVYLQRGFDLPVQNRISGQYPVVASNSVVGYHNEYKVKGPGVITGRSGTIGEVLYIEKDFWPLNTTLFAVDMRGNNPIYLTYFVRFFRLERFYRGVGVPTLNRNLVHGEKAPLVPFEQQQKFADLVQKVEALKAKQKQSETELQNLFNCLMQRAFKGYL